MRDCVRSSASTDMSNRRRAFSRPTWAIERLLADGQAEDELPAAAARGPEAYAMRLEQRDFVAALREMQGG